MFKSLAKGPLFGALGGAILALIGYLVPMFAGKSVTKYSTDFVDLIYVGAGIGALMIVLSMILGGRNEEEDEEPVSPWATPKDELDHLSRVIAGEEAEKPTKKELKETAKKDKETAKFNKQAEREAAKAAKQEEKSRKKNGEPEEPSDVLAKESESDFSNFPGSSGDSNVSGFPGTASSFHKTMDSLPKDLALEAESEDAPTLEVPRQVRRPEITIIPAYEPALFDAENEPEPAWLKDAFKDESLAFPYMLQDSHRSIPLPGDAPEEVVAGAEITQIVIHQHFGSEEKEVPSDEEIRILPDVPSWNPADTEKEVKADESSSLEAETNQDKDMESEGGATLSTEHSFVGVPQDILSEIALEAELKPDVDILELQEVDLETHSTDGENEDSKLANNTDSQEEKVFTPTKLEIEEVHALEAESKGEEIDVDDVNNSCSIEETTSVGHEEIVSDLENSQEDLTPHFEVEELAPPQYRHDESNDLFDIPGKEVEENLLISAEEELLSEDIVNNLSSEIQGIAKRIIEESRAGLLKADVVQLEAENARLSQEVADGEYRLFQQNAEQLRLQGIILGSDGEIARLKADNLRMAASLEELEGMNEEILSAQTILSSASARSECLKYPH